MKLRVVIHAGFHKTGTSTIQSFFRINRKRLRGLVQFPEPEKIRPALNVARSYSSSDENFLKLLSFQNAFAEFVEGQIGSRSPTLLISAEELSGHLPGRPHVETYRAAAPLARAMESILAEVFEVEDINFFYSLRRANTWLESAYWHHVSAADMRMSWEEYSELFSPSGNLKEIVDAVRNEVSSPVKSAYLMDQIDTEFGPATPIVELLDLPQSVQDELENAPIKNQRRSRELLAEMLKINRSNLSAKEKTAIKRKLKDEFDKNA